MFGECKGIREELGCVTVIIGGSSGFANRFERRGKGKCSGLIIAGSCPGVLFLVRRECTHVLVWRDHGSVGSLVVVTGGESTL
jgi:hypothetical protein